MNKKPPSTPNTTALLSYMNSRLISHSLAGLKGNRSWQHNGIVSAEWVAPIPASLTFSKIRGQSVIGLLRGVNSVSVWDLNICAWWISATEQSRVSVKWLRGERRELLQHSERPLNYLDEPPSWKAHSQHLPICCLHSLFAVAVLIQWFWKNTNITHIIITAVNNDEENSVKKVQIIHDIHLLHSP